MTVPFPIPDVVLPQARGSHARDVLRHISEAIELAEGVDGDVLASVLITAETTGGSAIGDGVAVVSARVPAHIAARRICAFACLSRPVSFRGVEQHPCDLVYVMISPEDEAQSHLRDLSSVIRAFRDRDFIDRLRSSGTSERMSSLFRARDMAVRKAA